MKWEPNLKVDTIPLPASRIELPSNNLVVRAWDQEIYFLYGLMFESCGCSYDGHWRLTWSLTLRPVELVEVHVSWLEHPH